ncbi:ccb74587-41ff-4ee5-926b-3646c8867fea [Thermothielavioides terrestris]|uniref:Ccb74587-41ff-4ee5-926b-3646c8867fea n=1 Tax=Thermothielavioides terrestris TaxID=2587410 RepID=A0A3S4BAX9_9PEZI|nr:ccb74587-41ff-4ee5-926b-3646c8867fea [Thermothielavioides terrestris]
MTQAYGSTSNLPIEIQHCALLQLLANSLVLAQTAPYLSCFDVLNLAATSRAFRFLIFHSPNVFRRLELSNVKTAQFDVDGVDHGGEVWRNVQLDETLTEDDFYSGPLRGIFQNLRRIDVLKDVQVLSLDGLSVTAELVHEILTDPSFSVRILSIRGVKNLNERRLCSTLRYACRESRPEGTPRLKGLYVFGPKDPAPASASSGGSRSPSPTSPAGVAAAWNARSQNALTAALAEESEAWYERRGGQFANRIDPEWASTLVACAGIIAFDSVLCAGPRHFNSPAWGAFHIENSSAAPSSSIPKGHVSRSCWECGMNCKECIEYTQRVCRRCGGGYCIIHNEGSNMFACDWCVGKNRAIRNRDLY